jgi:DNA polymerase/3'-5' exonuclease PolX
MTVTLDQIAAGTLEQLQPILASQHEPINIPLATAKARVAEIYARSQYLSPEERQFVMTSDPVTLAQRLAGSAPTNVTLAEHLTALADLYAILQDTFRGRTFRAAAATVEKFPHLITESRQLQGIRGIGISTLNEITEFLQSGTSKRLIALETQVGQQRHSLQDLQRVHGVGPMTALQFYQRGLRRATDLTDETLTAAQRIGLQYLEDLETRIPRDEMEQYAKRLALVLGPMGTDWQLAGSYRRQELTSGDIDMVIMASPKIPDVAAAVQAITPLGILRETLALGPKKYMGIAQLTPESKYRRLDIRVFAPAVWPFALLYNTGSDHVNILMRKRARELGYELSEYGLKPISGNRVPLITTEAEIFQFLGLQYLPPDRRTRDLSALPTEN